MEYGGFLLTEQALIHASMQWQIMYKGAQKPATKNDIKNNTKNQSMQHNGLAIKSQVFLK